MMGGNCLDMMGGELSVYGKNNGREIVSVC